MRILRPLPAALLATLAAVACAAGAPLGAQTPATPAAPAEARQAKPIDRANLDTTCTACADFYRYANGGWLERNEIPAAYSQWGSFNELADRNNEALRAVLDDLAGGKTAPTPTTTKLAALYGSCMDSTAVEAAGARPIAAALARIARVRTAAGVQAELAQLHDDAVQAGFGFYASPDQKRSTEVILNLVQGGLGLPDRDYYLKPDSASVKLRTAYVDHVARMLELAGTPAARARSDAQRVLEVETALARASMTRVQLRDPNATYHKLTVAELAQAAPGFDWAGYLRRRGLEGRATSLNVAQPDFAKAVATVSTGMPVESWRAYFRWKVVSDAAPQLSSAFVNESFRFGALLSGAKELLPRYKRCIGVADARMGEALGQAYVARTFSPAAKARALEMVANIQAVMRERLGALAWMSDATRQQALAKLDAFVNKIGYPDKWIDYGPLEVRAGDAFATNVMRADRFAVRRNVEKLGKPVDRGEWGMTPPTVNAYYNPPFNEIVFPAGILQPPFFDPNADDAVNYGGMGAVIGHEITHGFDDQGRQYDAQGNLRDWWTKEDADRFTKRADVVVAQFGGYGVGDAADDTLTKVNGKLTLGENIADLGGLTIAYHALQKSMQKKGRPAAIDGFTPEQRFFLAWAQIWRTNTRPEFARLLANVDPHAPGKWRTNGPLGNMPEFAKAWGCKAGDRMVRGDTLRAEIW